jgi:predicted Zn-dependent protease with MMP-like domain
VTRPSGPPSLARIALCALGAMCAGLTVVSLLSGFSSDPPVRVLEALAVFGAGAAILGGAVVLCLLRLAAWEESASEEDFEALVRHSEALAASGTVAPPGRAEPAAVRDADAPGDAATPAPLDALVRAAIDELPLEFHRVLEHVAVVVSDDGWRHRAYGLYQGDTVARDFFHDRILIFRDTLVRDFGHDPALLAAQVRRTVRHELAHHLGYSEPGVQGLGL